METQSFWLNVFALIVMLTLTWFMVYQNKKHGGFVHFLVLAIVFPCFVAVGGDLFHIVTNPPASGLHLLVSGMIWIAFVVVVVYTPDKKRRTQTNPL